METTYLSIAPLALILSSIVANSASCSWLLARYFSKNKTERTDWTLLWGENRDLMQDVVESLCTATLRQIGRFFGQTPGETESHFVNREARYFFHVQNGSMYQDVTGSVFASDREAVAHAAVLASELAQDEDWDDFIIVVMVAGGRVIAQIPARK